MNIVAIIPARGGSKGIINKNLKNVAGKPLITWTIEASLKSKYINRTIVSSDDDKILSIARQYGSQVIERPISLAQDDIPTEPVISHVLENEKALKNYEYFVLLQPTSPLRNHIDVDNAIELLIQKKASALISVIEIENKVLKAFMESSKGYLQGIHNNELPFKRRQDLPSVFMPNGAIYIIAVKEFLRNGRLFTEETIPFIMKKEKSIDIDNLDDIIQAEKMLKYNPKGS